MRIATNWAVANFEFEFEGRSIVLTKILPMRFKAELGETQPELTEAYLIQIIKRSHCWMEHGWPTSLRLCKKVHLSETVHRVKGTMKGSGPIFGDFVRVLYADEHGADSNGRIEYFQVRGIFHASFANDESGLYFFGRWCARLEVRLNVFEHGKI